MATSDETWRKDRLNSVHRSQVAAARSLGLTQRTALRYVILPQAVRNIIPPLLNDFIALQKDTSPECSA